MTNRLRIFLADDHAVVREGLKSLINSQPDMIVAGEAGDGAAAHEALQSCATDIAVVDLSMPGLTGPQLAERLREDCPDIRVLALTVHEDRSYLRQLLEAGAKGYVLKRTAADELINAIRIVADGGVYLDPHMAGRVVEGYIGAGPQSPEMPAVELSRREAEVVRLIARGYSNREIAGQLDLSVKTVETYKARVNEKMGLRTRADIVRYAVRRGWLDEV